MLLSIIWSILVLLPNPPQLIQLCFSERCLSPVGHFSGGTWCLRNTWKTLIWCFWKWYLPSEKGYTRSPGGMIRSRPSCLETLCFQFFVLWAARSSFFVTAWKTIKVTEILISYLKGTVHPKVQTCWKCTHPQAIHDVFEFFSSSLHHLLTNGSSAVNGCRQNESPNSW